MSVFDAGPKSIVNFTYDRCARDNTDANFDLYYFYSKGTIIRTLKVEFYTGTSKAEFKDCYFV